MTNFLNPNQNKPNRAQDVPPRPEPQKQDTQNPDLWFVSEDKSNKKDINATSKEVVKRSTNILAPIIGLTVIILLLGATIMFVSNLYNFN